MSSQPWELGNHAEVWPWSRGDRMACQLWTMQCVRACLAIYFWTDIAEWHAWMYLSIFAHAWSLMHAWYACWPACHHGINCPERHGHATKYLGSKWLTIEPISMHEVHGCCACPMHAWSMDTLCKLQETAGSRTCLFPPHADRTMSNRQRTVLVFTGGVGLRETGNGGTSCHVNIYIKLSCMHDFMQPCSIPSPLDQAFPLMQNQGPKT